MNFIQSTKTTIAFALFGIALATSPPVLANEEHGISTIQGTQIDLKTYDHAFAGIIKDFLVFGAMDEETFTSELTLRKDGQLIKTVFGKQTDGTVGGTLRHTVDSKEITTTLRFVKLIKEENKLVFEANGEGFSVSITSDAFDHNHFINPTYQAEIHGKTVAFTFKGRACFGYSLHLIFMIVSAFIHGA